MNSLLVSRVTRLRMAVCLLLGAAGLASAAAGIDKHEPLADVSLQQVQQLVPVADDLGAITGEVPVRAVHGDEKLLGYVFLTDDIMPIPAYSGRPIRTLVAIDLAARIVGATILHHEEPILVIGITDSDLETFLSQFGSLMAFERVRIGAHERAGYIGIDGITGATITTMVLNSSIMKAAQLVAVSQDLPRTLTSPVDATSNSEVSTTDRAGTMAGLAAEEPAWVELWREQRLEIVLR